MVSSFESGTSGSSTVWLPTVVVYVDMDSSGELRSPAEHLDEVVARSPLVTEAGNTGLTESRASTLIGVFISVTTIPAAADIGLSISYASWSEAWGSFLQLLLNVSILIVVGMIMLLVQKRIWDRVTPTAGSAPQP